MITAVVVLNEEFQLLQKMNHHQGSLETFSILERQGWSKGKRPLPYGETLKLCKIGFAREIIISPLSSLCSLLSSRVASLVVEAVFDELKKSQ